MTEVSEFAVRSYALPLKVRYVWAKGDHDLRKGAIVRATLPSGVGWGEIAFGPHVPIDGPALEKEALDLVSGLDFESDDFLEALDARGPHNRIRNGIATAWLSARAAQQGLPLNRFLRPEQTPASHVPINGLVNKLDIQEMLQQSHDYAAQGMTAFKVKCFEDVETDLERVAALRGEFPDAVIRIDPNDAWMDPDAALHNLERFAPMGIDYVEDPLNSLAASFSEMAYVRARSPIDVAWDNPVDDMTSMVRLLDADAIDVFVFKMPRSGGPDRQLAMFDVARAEGKRFVLTGPLETAIGTTAGLHVASLMGGALPPCGFSLAAHFDKDNADLAPVNEGKQRVPSKPGLGTAPYVFDQAPSSMNG